MFSAMTPTIGYIGHGPNYGVHGSPGLPELPKVSPAEWPDKVTDGESLELVEEAAILAAPGAVALFQRFTCKLSFKRNLLTLEEKVHLLAQRFELLLSHDYTASSTGLYIQSLPLAERVTCVVHALEGKAEATLKKRLAASSKYVQFCCNAGMSGFPLDVQPVLQYTAALMEATKVHGALTGFVEACGFLLHVLGVREANGALSHPIHKAKGRLRKVRVSPPPRRQARAMTVFETRALEDYVRNTKNAAQDRYAAGCYLFGIYSRSRLGDLRSVKQFVICCDEGFHLGLLECVSLSHKSRSCGNAMGLELPLIAPAKALCEEPWAKAWIEASRAAGCDLARLKDGSPLLQAPLVSGEWSGLPISNAKFAMWVAAILESCCEVPVPRFTGHSAKATVLSWLAKYGVDEDSRTVLGHHVGKNKMVATYSRDLQAGPLRKMMEVIAQIRDGRFQPDLRRACLVMGEAAPPVSPEGGVSSVAGSQPGSPHSVAHLLPSEADDERAYYDEANVLSDPPDFEPPPAPASEAEVNDYLDNAFASLADDRESAGEGPGAEGEVTDSGSSSSSSGTSSSSDDQDEALVKSSVRFASLRPAILNGAELFQHVRTKTIHWRAEGSTSDRFVCGRVCTKDHRRIRTPVSIASWKCKQCEAGKPLNDLGSLNTALEKALKRRA